MSSDWLSDFVAHTDYGETPSRIMYWVGVTTIAGALRRKVWIEQDSFQWTPNFYMIIVGRPGVIKKSTSIGLGTRLLKHVEGIDFGPQIITWQQLITHMADSRQVVEINGEDFEMSCVTISLSEFGSFFDPKNRDLVDNLTDIWDGRLGAIKKETKTSGNDEIINGWLNIYACTTPKWMSTHFSDALVGGGFACRCVWLYGDKRARRVAYPARQMPSLSIMRNQRDNLIEGLRRIAEYKGEYQITEEAYAWGDVWYEKYCDRMDALGETVEAEFEQRKQTHLHKLAMVISASRGMFPVIDVSVLQEAESRLVDLEFDSKKIFGYVGQSTSSRIGSDILAALARTGRIKKMDLYRNLFFRTISIVEFEEALKSAKASGLVLEGGPVTDPVIYLR